MLRLSIHALALSLSSLSVVTATQVNAQQPSIRLPGSIGKGRAQPPGIIDEGFPDFRQFVDVNNDKVVDYCRLVGTYPNIFLSCQLGSKSGGFAAVPYAFSAPAGTDLGSGPRLIFPLGEYQPAFCRYIPIPFKGTHVVEAPTASKTHRNIKASAPEETTIQEPSAQPIPSLDVAKELSCIQAKPGGFDATKEIDPNTRMPNKTKVALLKGTDGATIELVYGGTKSSWLASVQDGSGRHFHLSGLSTLSKELGVGYMTYLKLSSDEDDSGKPFSSALLAKYPRANIIIDEFFQITKSGYVSYSISGTKELSVLQPAGILNTGYTVTRSGTIKGSEVLVWDGCAPPNPNSPSTPYLGTLGGDGSVDWKGPQPPSLDTCTPSSISRLDYFSEVFKVLEAKTKDYLRTGNPSIDNKDLLQLDASDIAAVINNLKVQLSQAKTENDKQRLLDAIGVLNSIQSACNNLGLGVAGSAIAATMMSPAAGPLAPIPAISGATVVVASGLFLVVTNVVIETAKAAVQNSAYNDCKKTEQSGGYVSDECAKRIFDGP